MTIGIVVAVLWQWLAHWLPWHGFFDKHISAFHMAAYAMGVLGICAGFGVFVLVEPRASADECFGALMRIVVASGLATGLAYGVDALAEMKGRAAIAPKE